MSERVLVLAGLAVLAAVWAGPLPELSATRFAAHMTAHMAVVAVGAPLIALGIAGTALDPTRRDAGAALAVVASIVELAAVWGWHLPDAHQAARHDGMIFAVEQTTFLAVGLLLWLSAFGGSAEGRRARAGAGVVAMLFTSMHMTLLGALFALTPRPLYAHVASAAPARALEDQQLGGAIMIVAGGVAYLAGGLWAMRRVLAPGCNRADRCSS